MSTAVSLESVVWRCRCLGGDFPHGFTAIDSCTTFRFGDEAAPLVLNIRAEPEAAIGPVAGVLAMLDDSCLAELFS